VVSQVPLAWESITRNGTFASVVDAKEGLVAVSMQPVSFTLVAEKASGR
jgi:hypothetical protein